ncbi:hypothetical protein DPX39_000024800 [Trypanosoma brucei equiperdum]|uniref:Uncharacterized protein n=1 Tax=Trypanosoma brucei equiperdum TaxID=630700 RepID=A0A3L6KTT6_9TRYP|nr:hypothetical protein DPX39_000024800 [Trypanosoma brucei equiperdum]
MVFRDASQPRRMLVIEDIVTENRKRMELMGINANNESLCRLLLQMMSGVGELSNLAEQGEGALSLSRFEQEEVRTLIGRLAVSLFTVADICEVNLGQTAMDFISDQIQRKNSAPSLSFKEASKRSAPVPIVGDKGTGNHALYATEQPQVLLSPTSNRDFFSQLDALLTHNREDFEKADLKWVAPLPDGTVHELIENGSTINVSYDDIPMYLEKIQRYRNARVTEISTMARHCDVNTRHGSRPKGAAVAVCASDAKKERFDQLFSPPSTADSALLNSNIGAVKKYPSPSEIMLQQPNPVDATLIGVVVSEAEFQAKVEAIKSGHIFGPAIAQQNLTFSVPRGGKLVELVPNGIHMKVTSANVSEFLRLLNDKSAALGGRVRRLESIKKLEVAGVGSQDLSREKGKFSPTHFSKDIFAPYDERTSFFVDTDASEEILPLYLRDQEELQRRADTYYVHVIRQGDIKTWNAIFEQVQADPSMLKKYGVTFCVPSSFSSHGSENEQRPRIHELITRGSTTPVEESQLWLFTKMVKQVMHPSA